jgi:hypothetical protein
MTKRSWNLPKGEVGGLHQKSWQEKCDKKSAVEKVWQKNNRRKIAAGNVG